MQYSPIPFLAHASYRIFPIVILELGADLALMINKTIANKDAYRRWNNFCYCIYVGKNRKVLKEEFMTFRRSITIKGTSQWLKMKVAEGILQSRAWVKSFVLWFFGIFLLDFFLISSKYDADSSAVKGLLFAMGILLLSAVIRSRRTKRHMLR